MNRDRILALLQEVESGSLAAEAALERLARFPFVDTPSARVDTQRGLRQGLPEVVFGPGKSVEQIVEVEIEFAREQVKAGADIIGLGDAVASQISADMYKEFALPFEQRIFAAVHELGAVGRLHICGDTTHILDAMAESGADMIDIDWMVDIEQAAVVFDGRAALCGNFDPVAVMLQGSPDDVEQAVLDCQAKGGARYFSAAGCEIPDGTPEENLRAQVGALMGISSLRSQ